MKQVAKIVPQTLWKYGIIALVVLALSGLSARAQQYAWSTIAGTPGSTTAVDGTGTAAQFLSPYGIAIDGSGNLFVTDAQNDTVREITPQAVVTTVAGQSYVNGSTDATGTAATFFDLGGITEDGSGNAYIVDSGNSTIRKMTAGYVVSTVAGAAGQYGSLDGVGSLARFHFPHGVCSDTNGNLFVADSYNGTIREITSDGTVSTIAGTALVIGTADGMGAAASFNHPYGVTVDSNENLYAVDTGGNTVRKITPDGTVTTFVGTPNVTGTADGTGPAAQFNFPTAITIDGSNNLYVTDAHNDTIRKITPSGVVTTIGGIPGVAGTTSGIGSDAGFSGPDGIVIAPNGVIYIADSGNTRIVEGVPSTGTGSLNVVISPAGAVNAGAQWQVDGGPSQASGATVAGLEEGSHVVTFGTAAGWVTPASVNVTVNAGDVTMLVDTYTAVPPPSSPGQYTWVNLAGVPGVSGTNDGPEAEATFSDIQGIAVDGSGNIFVDDSASNTIREISTNGTVSTVVGRPGFSGSTDGTGSAALFSQPFGIAFGLDGNLDIVDSANGTIRVMTPGDAVTTIAGVPFDWGYADGTGTNALFHFPSQIATDAAGNMYVADSYNDTIRKVTPAGVVTTIAGAPLQPGSVDGTGTNARFWHPYGVAVDSSTNIFVEDEANNTIRKISSAGVVTTIAGVPGVGGTADGYGSAALFYQPFALAIDGSDNLYVADSGNNTIRKITPGGYVTTIGGTPGVTGTAGGVGAAARFSNPWGITVTPNGVVYVSDSQNHRVMMGIPPTSGTFSVNNDLAFTPGNGPVTIDVLQEDTAPGGGTLSIVGVTQGSFGRVTVNSNGTITYTPAGSYQGVDSFTYTVSDGLGQTQTVTVLIGNGFLTGAGTYTGLVSNAVVTNSDSGAITLTLTKTGQYTGQLAMAGLDYRLSGSFNDNWSSEFLVKRTGQASLQVALALDAGDKQVTGTVTDGTFDSTVTADVATYNAKTNPAPASLAGNYTVILPPDPDTAGDSDYPQGIGYLTLSVSAGGNVSASGKLGDGTPFSASGLLVSGSDFPLYASLYGKAYPQAGSISGTIALGGTSNASGGLLAWFKPRQSSGAYYKSGFSTTTQATGSAYEAPKSGARILQLANNEGVLDFNAGGLLSEISEPFILLGNNKVVFSPDAGDKTNPSLTFNLLNGTFTGSFDQPNGPGVIKRAFSGAVLQDDGVADGLFLGSSQSGSIELQP